MKRWTFLDECKFWIEMVGLAILAVLLPLFIVVYATALILAPVALVGLAIYLVVQ